MGLEDVKNEIIQEAKQEKKQILEGAEEQKQEMLEEAEKKAEEIREEAEEEIEDEKAAVKKRTESNANMEAKKKKLEAKQDAIREVFRGFREELEGLSEQKKQDFFDRAVDNVDFEVGKVIGSSDFEDKVSGHDFEESDRQGVTLVSSNGERRVDYTFDKIVEDFREDYRKKVAEKLFE